MITKDIRGAVFGPWTVAHRINRPEGIRTQGAFWVCVCLCENTEILSGARLRAGRVHRGCLQCADRDHNKRGKCSREYNSWRAMRGRCLRPDDDGYSRYGGRGITICERWRNSFANFLADMGPRPPRMSLDRIKSNGHYEPSNCRWAEAKTQARNTEHFKVTDEQIEVIHRVYTKHGVTQSDIAVLIGIGCEHISNIVAGRGSRAA